MKNETKLAAALGVGVRLAGGGILLLYDLV